MKPMVLYCPPWYQEADVWLLQGSFSSCVPKAGKKRDKRVESACWIVWGPIDWCLAQPSDFYDFFFKYLMWNAGNGSYYQSLGETSGLPVYSASSVVTFFYLEYESLATKCMCPLRLWTLGKLGIEYTWYPLVFLRVNHVTNSTDISKESSRHGSEQRLDSLPTLNGWSICFKNTLCLTMEDVWMCNVV